MIDKKTAASRGRPRAFDTNEAVKRAMRLFHQRGYDAVGVAELSKTIGVNPPSLYSAFGSKSGLFKRVVECYVAEKQFIAEVLSQNEGVAEAIATLFARAADVYTEIPELPGCLVMDGTRGSVDKEACMITAAFRAATRQFILERICTELSVKDAEPLTDYVMVTLYGMSAAARDGMTRQALSRVATVAAAGFPLRLSQ